MTMYEFNKIAGAVLGTALAVMAVRIIAEEIYAPTGTEEPGVTIATTEQPGAAGGGQQVAAGEQPAAGAEQPAASQPPSGGGGGEAIAALLQTADAKVGETKARICMACHTLDKGGAAKVGPNLYGIVGDPAAHAEGFTYSDAMLQKRADGMTWTFANLDGFLTAPKEFIPGTAMGFAGFKDPKDRANVIAYLRTLSDNPVPLPQAAAGPPAGPAPPPSAMASQPPPAGPPPSAMAPQPPPAAPPPPAVAQQAPPPAASAPPAAGAAEPIDVRLQSADAAAGQAKSRICLACHTFDEGGAAKVGPNLYGVVGGPVAHAEGFGYSDAMTAKHGEGMTWTFENLDQFLAAPKDFIPGTAMGFAGFKDPKDRANVIAYLRSLSANPVPLQTTSVQPTAPAGPQTAMAPQPPAAPPPAVAQQQPSPPPPATPPASAPSASGASPIADRMKTADARQGEVYAAICMACHNLEKGGPTVVGPNLYGVVGSPAGHHEGFEYSDAMKAKAAAGLVWTYENLDQFLSGPEKFIPGTFMTFEGLPDPQQRADAIAFLRTKSDNPPPLP
jgi:cytochrome c